MKCCDRFCLNLILAIITLIACILRSIFLIIVLIHTTQPNSNEDPNINIIFCLNTVAYLILALTTVLLIYAIVKKLHKLMLPWLVIAIHSLLFEVIFVIYTLASGRTAKNLFILIGTGLGTWIFYMVFKLYKAIRLANELKASNDLDANRTDLDTL